MKNTDILVKNMISREVQTELVRNIVLDFSKLDKNIDYNLQTQLLGIFGTNNKKIKQKTLIQEYSILK